ncbi:MAG: FAD-binding oxidoreductase, partial [Gammaproteobacteria bacterium]
MFSQNSEGYRYIIQPAAISYWPYGYAAASAFDNVQPFGYPNNTPYESYYWWPTTSEYVNNTFHGHYIAGAQPPSMPTVRTMTAISGAQPPSMPTVRTMTAISGAQPPSMPTIRTMTAISDAQPPSMTTAHTIDIESAQSKEKMSKLKFEGEVYFRGEKDYNSHCYQYASSSHDINGSMRPVAIIYAKGDNDIKKAIAYANNENIAIAIRTGGHQYSGSSSTYGRNILLDMSHAYLEDSKAWVWNEVTSELTTSISHRLAEFNEKLKKFKIFVPHGQCSHVGIGGHLNTGGYGQLGRAFGLFADHITSFRIITADGTILIVSRDSSLKLDKDLFYAVLGGSPGKFGVVTHITLKMHSDKDHPYSRGFKKFCVYTKERLKALLDIKVQMAKDPNFLGDFDYCVTVMSGKQPVLPDTLDANMITSFPKIYDDKILSLDNIIPCNVIVIYAQWSNVDGKKDTSQKNLKTAME